jgi:hypothetical protein
MVILPILTLGLFCAVMLDSAFGGQAWMVDVGWFWPGSRGLSIFTIDD